MRGFKPEALEANDAAGIINLEGTPHGTVGDRKALPNRVGGPLGALVSAAVSVDWARGKMVGGR
jgi:hypothetical protein